MGAALYGRKPGRQAAREASATAAGAAAAVAKRGALAKRSTERGKRKKPPHGLPPPMHRAARSQVKHRARPEKEGLQPHR